MKINAINSSIYMTKHNRNFKGTAVPYPEYENAYYSKTEPDAITRVVTKLSALFTPEVTQKSQEIKNGINKIYNDNKQTSDYVNTPKTHLLSVLA